MLELRLCELIEPDILSLNHLCGEVFLVPLEFLCQYITVIQVDLDSFAQLLSLRLSPVSPSGRLIRRHAFGVIHQDSIRYLD